MAAMDLPVAELERSYAEAQARLSDPAVYNDHREAADAGRRRRSSKACTSLRSSGAAYATTSTRPGRTPTQELLPELEERLGALERS